jgi:hypothetical protein
VHVCRKQRRKPNTSHEHSRITTYVSKPSLCWDFLCQKAHLLLILHSIYVIISAMIIPESPHITIGTVDDRGNFNISMHSSGPGQVEQVEGWGPLQDVSTLVPDPAKAEYMAHMVRHQMDEVLGFEAMARGEGPAFTIKIEEPEFREAASIAYNRIGAAQLAAAGRRGVLAAMDAAGHAYDRKQEQEAQHQAAVTSEAPAPQPADPARRANVGGRLGRLLGGRRNQK